MSNRILGTIGMICAPAMLVEALIPNGTNIPLVVGIASMVFMVGSFCSHLGLWRIAATGSNWWGRAVLAIQLVLVTLAFAFGLFEATGLLSEDNILFTITDISWPVSMIWMLAVGITAAVVGRLQGWQRFVPLLCGMVFITSLLLVLLFNLEMGSDAMGLISFTMLLVFWGLLGFVVRQSETPLPETQVAIAARQS